MGRPTTKGRMTRTRLANKRTGNGEEMPTGKGREIVLRGLRLAATATACLAGIAAICVPSASALETRVPVGSPFGSFVSPTGITVEQSTGNVFVVDSGSNEVKIFGPEGGAPVGGGPSVLTGAGTPGGTFEFGGEPSGPAAVDGTVYVADVEYNGTGRVVKFVLNNTTHVYEYVCEITAFGASGDACTSSGTSGGSPFHEPLGVAVDVLGDLYVTNLGSKAVYEFNPAGEQIASFISNELPPPEHGSGFAEPVYVAAAANGTLYVEKVDGRVFEMTRASLTSPIAEYVVPPGSGEPKRYGGSAGRGFTYDGAAGRLLVDEQGGERVDEYDVGNEDQVASFGEGLLTAGNFAEGGVAVDEATGDVYVTSGGHVQEFGPPIILPTPVTGAAEDGTKSAVVLTGSVNPQGGGETHYYFQYGTSTAYGQQTAEASVAQGSAAEPVSMNVTGLSGASEYHYRLVARNANGTVYGNDASFTTPAVTVAPCAAQNVSSMAASLCTAIDPEGEATSYVFVWGLEAHGSVFEYESVTSYESTGTGNSTKSLESFFAPIGGLEPATTYHYRVYAINNVGATEGPDESVTTLPAEPTVNDKSPFATEIALHEATLHGTINPGKGITEFYFRYGPAAGDYTQQSPVSFTPLNYQDDAVQQLITGLEPGRTYHYALVATNSSGTATGSDEVFSTIPSTPPAAITGEPSALTSTSVVLSGAIEPRERPVGYVFEVGTSAAYGTKIFGSLEPGLSGEALVSVSVGGLLPGTTYHYRLVASSVSGTSVGQDRTFATPLESALLAAPLAPSLVPIPAFPAVEGTAAGTSKGRGAKAKHKRAKKRRRSAHGGARGRRARRSRAARRARNQGERGRV
jgi:hypothetical protein